jgi:hypothetical protein
MKLGKLNLMLYGLGAWLLANPRPASAESSICPSTGKYVETGDSSTEVKEKCGAPTSKEPVSAYRCPPQYRCHKSQRAERWSYDFGSVYLVRYLLFLDDQLVQIEYGDYGKNR